MMQTISLTMLNDPFFSEEITWISYLLKTGEEEEYSGTPIRAIFEYAQSAAMVVDPRSTERILTINAILSDEYQILKEDQFVIDGITWTPQGEPTKDREGMQQLTLIHVIEKIKGRW